MLKNSTEGTDFPEVSAIFVTSEPDNYAGLSDILARCGQECRWNLIPCRSMRTLLRQLRRDTLPVVFFEIECEGNSWKRFMAQAGELPDPPAIVLVSRTADETLWSEALNRGAYDLLPIPLNEQEVSRVAVSAWLHWKNRPRGANLSVSAAP